MTDVPTGRSLLFFLEVDLATESLTSSNGAAATISRKIAGYQALFRCEGYKRYEANFGHTFNGFRVLFVTSTAPRALGIGRLVERTPPSGFIWITEQERMFRDGMGAPIWSRGGRVREDAVSILGPTLACRAPIEFKEDG